jgi:hypothetical protein
MITIWDKKLNQDSLETVIKVLCHAFKSDPLYCAVFQNEKDLCRYIRLMVNYYHHNGEIHVALVDGRIIGASVWNHKGTPFFSFRAVLTSGMFGDILKFIMLIQLKSMVRLKNETMITERHHFKRAHHYLFMIGSVRKGAGSALMEHAIKKFNNYPIYLENSNIKDNQSFYEKLGFHSIKVIEVMGVSVDLMSNSKGDLENEKFDC